MKIVRFSQNGYPARLGCCVPQDKSMALTTPGSNPEAAICN
jgi:hypothetical protein